MVQLQRALKSIAATLGETEKSLRHALNNLSGDISSRGKFQQRLTELLRSTKAQTKRLTEYRDLLELAMRRHQESVEESRRLADSRLSISALVTSIGAQSRSSVASSLEAVQSALQDPNSPLALSLQSRSSIEKMLQDIFPYRRLSEEEKKAAVHDLLREAGTGGGTAISWVTDKADSALGWAGDRIGDAAGWVDQTISNIDYIGDVWDDVVHSDMAGYLFDLGMDGLGLICDTGSLFKNAVTLNWGEAALDLYDIMNGTFAMGGSMSAVFAEGMSFFFTGEDREYWKNQAREQAGNDGLADVLRSEDLDELAVVVDLTDTVHSGAKTGIGAGKLAGFTTAVKADQASLGEIFEAATGFKSGPDPLDSLENLKTGLEYAEGVGEKGVIQTIAEHTMPGKMIKGGMGTLENAGQMKEDVNAIQNKQ